MISTRIEVIDANRDVSLARIVVPGEVVPEQIRKDLRVNVVLIVDAGEKTKKKTVNIKIYDDDLMKRLEEYVDNLVKVRLVAVSTTEEVRGELSLSDIKTS